MSNLIYAPLEMVKAYALRHNLTTIEKWLEAADGEKWPEIMPKRPVNVYGCKWSDVLAPKTISNSKFVTYDEARVMLKLYKISSMREFRLMGREGKRPSTIPSNPERHYKDDWKGWPNFLSKDDA